MKIKMVPHPESFGEEVSGIRRVVEAYFRHLPKYGVEFVSEASEEYDLVADHAGAAKGKADIAHNHGLYFSGDFDMATWEWRINASVINALRHAREVTVPSAWMAETFQREMRFTPHVIPNGVEWDEWQGPSENRGYVLWNKNRNMDVCDPTPVRELAMRFPHNSFTTTFSHNPPANVNVIGLRPFEEMKDWIKSAAVYLATTKETFGIGILEAMASGIPILGFSHGGVLDLVRHGVDGYLAEPGDWKDLAEGLAWCLDNRAKAGENGRERSKEFTWEKACEQVAEIYHKAMEPDPPTVSIIIPSFNYADKVGRAIGSAINQTYPDLVNIIVVDDGSEDDGATRKVVEEYQSRDARVEYIRQQNQGVAVARNAGITHAHSKYVACLDADDAIAPRYLEVTVPALEDDRSIGIAYTGLFYMKPDGEQDVSSWPGVANFDEQILKRNQIPTCCVFRKEMWARLGGYKKRYAPKGAGAEDAEFWLRSGAAGWGAKLVDPFPHYLDIYTRVANNVKRAATREELIRGGLDDATIDLANESFFVYSWESGRVSGDPNYQEPDWLGWHPWAGENGDGLHPFASAATPANLSHPVRQYDEPAVSVIIPVGKGHSHLLADALDSLEAQTFRRWEAIVVLDQCDFGSTRSTEDQFASDEFYAFEKAYPYVKFLVASANSQGPNGPGWARNFGVELKARAPFLLFLDADDYLYPKALERLLDVWRDTAKIPYPDYVGKATLEDPNSAKLAKDLRERIYQWDEETGDAVIGYRGAEYDCERAQRQPEGDGTDPYLWSNVTCLIPRAWHDEIGGFDEKMGTWEDVDYHWRMARAGKCYIRVPEELMVYRFNTGLRREHGLHIHSEVVEYIKGKYQEVETKMCNCGSKQQTPAPTPQQMGVAIGGSSLPSVRTPRSADQMTDQDLVKARYISANRGQHRVIGHALFPVPFQDIPMVNKGNGYVIDYGRRAGGDTFLVHQRDLELAGHLFQAIDDGTIRAPVVDRAPPPPPPTLPPAPTPSQMVAPSLAQPTGTPSPTTPSSGPPFVPASPEPHPREIETGASDTIRVKPVLDIQLLPGITADVAAQFEADGITTLAQVKALGVKGIQKYRGIGAVKAPVIMDAIAAYEAQTG